MNDELLPESIRGGWYVLGTDADLEEAGRESGGVLVFSLDGSFAQYDLADGERVLEEEGDYTFDGQFLILRGADTETYRVHPESNWRWYLEAKKDDFLLLRGWTDLEAPFELGEERLTEIESVPARVFVRSEFGGPEEGEICSLIHESDGEELQLGACYAETGEEGVDWVGLSPFTSSIPDPLWERIVRRSYLEIYRDDESSDVEVEILR